MIRRKNFSEKQKNEIWTPNLKLKKKLFSNCQHQKKNKINTKTNCERYT